MPIYQCISEPSHPRGPRLKTMEFLTTAPMKYCEVFTQCGCKAEHTVYYPEGLIVLFSLRTNRLARFSSCSVSCTCLIVHQTVGTHWESCARTLRKITDQKCLIGIKGSLTTPPNLKTLSSNKF